MNTDNAKFDHVYAIIRIDCPPSAKTIAVEEVSVTVTRVLFNKDMAEREVDRLNTLNSQKGCQYICQLTRLEKKAVPNM